MNYNFDCHHNLCAYICCSRLLFLVSAHVFRRFADFPEFLKIGNKNFFITEEDCHCLQEQALDSLLVAKFRRIIYQHAAFWDRLVLKDKRTWL